MRRVAEEAVEAEVEAAVARAGEMVEAAAMAVAEGLAAAARAAERAAEERAAWAGAATAVLVGLAAALAAEVPDCSEAKRRGGDAPARVCTCCRASRDARRCPRNGRARCCLGTSIGSSQSIGARRTAHT